MITFCSKLGTIMVIKARTLWPKSSSKNKSNQPQAKDVLVLTITVHNSKISAPNIAFCPFLDY